MDFIIILLSLIIVILIGLVLYMSYKLYETDAGLKCPECQTCPTCPDCPKCPDCPENSDCPDCPVCPDCPACPACPDCDAYLNSKLSTCLGPNNYVRITDRGSYSEIPSVCSGYIYGCNDTVGGNDCYDPHAFRYIYKS